MRAGGSNAPSLERVRFILNKIKEYYATGRGDYGGSRWNSQHDQTAKLEQFEQTSFRLSSSMFLHCSESMLTLDDDLYGTRAKDNQVKTLSHRKA